MNDDMPRFSGGYGQSPYSAPAPQAARAGQAAGGVSRAFLLMMMVIACVVLGILLAWGSRERIRLVEVSDRNRNLANAYTVVLAQRNDLAAFLTDPRTRLFQLAGHNEASGRRATVAWQAQTQSGVLIGDDVPLPADDAAYALWRVDTGGAVTPAGRFRPDSAGTYFKFHVAGDPPSPAEGFRVTIERDRDARRPTGALAYDTPVAPPGH